MMATTTVNFDAIHCYDPDDIPLGPNAIRADADGREYVLRTRPDETWIFLVWTETRDSAGAFSASFLPSEAACELAAEMVEEASSGRFSKHVCYKYRKVG
jgi:hypothetical protein